MLNVLEKCRISPPPAAIGDRSLPLTFFDSAWLLFFPIHQVFFYEFPDPTSYFLETIVPKLKHSLSITLQHFFPFAGNLIVFPNPNRSPNGKTPEIRHVEGEDDLERFLCVVDWRSRIHPPLPQTYFGNCVGPCICTPTKSTLLASNTGFRTAAEVLGKALSETIKNKDALMKDAETWLEIAYERVPTIGVSGTPKFRVYDVDFGWGKAKKHETPSIDYNGSISVNACRDSPADIEIGISLPAKQLDAFISISRVELESNFYEQD
ncbi:putative anthocyanin 6''-O-malonyltransferase [Helianthus debilis subsp. tardiflorus]